jgi:hypothetical protein
LPQRLLVHKEGEDLKVAFGYIARMRSAATSVFNRPRLSYVASICRLRFVIPTVSKSTIRNVPTPLRTKIPDTCPPQHQSNQHYSLFVQ